jgi:DNA-binding transcriptional LysR family regulator
VSDINWNAIYGFWLVSETHSFAAASRSLPRGSVQALHKRVRTLEDTLKLRLLRSRGTKGVELTEAGRRIFKLIDPMFRQFDRLTDELRAEDSGPLHVAATGFCCHNFLPDVLSAFCPQVPNVSVHVHMREASEVVALVQSGRVDFGVCSPPANLGKCEIRVEVPLPSAILVPKKHELARGVRSWKDVVRHPLILPERESLLRTHFDDLMVEENLFSFIHVKAEFTAPGLSLQAVRDGLGVALVDLGPRLLANLEGVLPLAPPPGLPRMRLAVLCQRNRYLPRYMRSFLETVSRVMRSLPKGLARSGKD